MRFMLPFAALGLTLGCAATPAPQAAVSTQTEARSSAPAAATSTLPSYNPVVASTGAKLPDGLSAPLFTAGRSWTYNSTTAAGLKGMQTMKVQAADAASATLAVDTYTVKLDRTWLNPYGALLSGWAVDQAVKTIINQAEPVTVPAGSFTAVHYLFEDHSLNSAWLEIEVWATAEAGLVKYTVLRHDYGPPSNQGRTTWELAAKSP